MLWQPYSRDAQEESSSLKIVSTQGASVGSNSLQAEGTSSSIHKQQKVKFPMLALAIHGLAVICVTVYKQDLWQHYQEHDWRSLVRGLDEKRQERLQIPPSLAKYISDIWKSSIQ